jgi:hypothetical protein
VLFSSLSSTPGLRLDPSMNQARINPMFDAYQRAKSYTHSSQDNDVSQLKPNQNRDQIDKKGNYMSITSQSRQSLTSTGNSPWRKLLPNLLLNAIVPLLAYNLLVPHMSTLLALLLASVIPAGSTLFGLLKNKHLDPIGLLVIFGLLLSSLAAVFFNSPRLILLHGSLVGFLLGLTFLVSLHFPRPLFFYLLRSFVTANQAEHVARFNATWAYPKVRTLCRLLTFVWGSMTIVGAVIQACIALTFPIGLALTINQVLNLLIIFGLTAFTVSYTRRRRYFFTPSPPSGDLTQPLSSVH